MGADTINRAAELVGLPARISLTENLRLHGWSDKDQADHYKVYGTDVDWIKNLNWGGYTFIRRLTLYRGRSSLGRA